LRRITSFSLSHLARIDFGRLDTVLAHLLGASAARARAAERKALAAWEAAAIKCTARRASNYEGDEGVHCALLTLSAWVAGA
jgi:hypothetical protein